MYLIKVVPFYYTELPLFTAVCMCYPVYQTFTGEIKKKTFQVYRVISLKKK